MSLGVVVFVPLRSGSQDVICVFEKPHCLKDEFSPLIPPICSISIFVAELSDFDGNLDVLKFMAIKCSYRNIFVYEAALLFPQFILNHRLEFIALFQIDKRSVISKATLNTAKQMRNLSIVRTSNVKFDVQVEELKDQEDSVYKALHEFLLYLVNAARVNRKEFHDSSIAKYINSRFGIPMSYMDYYYKNYKN